MTWFYNEFSSYGLPKYRKNIMRTDHFSPPEVTNWWTSNGFIMIFLHTNSPDTKKHNAYWWFLTSWKAKIMKIQSLSNDVSPYGLLQKYWNPKVIQWFFMFWDQQYWIPMLYNDFSSFEIENMKISVCLFRTSSAYWWFFAGRWNEIWKT